MKKVAIHLANGFEEIEALTTVDLLRRVNIDVTTVSMEKTNEVNGGHDIKVITDKHFSEINYSEIDMIVLPGGMPGTTNLDSSNPLKNMISAFAEQGKYIAAICAAPLILGKLGLLKGKKAVCFPGFEKYLEGAEILETPTVKDGNIITGRGAGVATDFALKLIETLKDKETADELSRKILYR